VTIPLYHEELEQEIHLPGGQTLLLRPIRPEDKRAYVKLFESLPPEDIAMRFLSPMKALSDSLATRLTQIDCRREMALALVDKCGSGETELLGVVRFSADPDNERAEFAILLRRNLTGIGLGPMMMRRIIECARKRGIKEIFGEVLSENAPMLKLCGALGFRLERMPNEPGVTLASFHLRNPW
jgi:acetyltransferase